MAAERTFFEDVGIGEKIVTPALTITEAHVSLYRGLTAEATDDPRAVPALLPLALSTGLGWRVPRPPLAVKAFLGVEWEILQPLTVGDTVHGASRTVTRRPMRDGGVIIDEYEVIDQRGVVAQRGRVTFLVERRPGAPAKPAGGRRGVPPAEREVPSS